MCSYIYGELPIVSFRAAQTVTKKVLMQMSCPVAFLYGAYILNNEAAFE